MSAIHRLRQKVAQSPLGGVIRRAGLARLLDAAARPLYRAAGPARTTFGGVELRFGVANPREARAVADLLSEREHVELMLDDLRDGDVFYDVGANIGVVSSAVAAGALARGLDVQVEAFEPEPMTAARLEHNLRLNDLDGVRIHRVALADDNGSMQLHVIGGLGSGRHSIMDKHTNFKEIGSVEVPVWRGPDYAEAQGLAHPTVLKIDVEGAEGRVLRGAARWMDDPRLRRIDVELHVRTLEDAGESVEDLIRLATSRDFVEQRRMSRGGEVICVLERAGA